MKTHSNHFVIAYRFLIVIVAVGFFLMFALTPLMGDDFWYLMTSSGTSGFEACRLAMAESVRHWHFDTGRLANLISAPFLTIIPKWIFGIISTAILILDIAVCRRFIHASQGSFRAFMLVLGIVFILPWIDYMFTVIFALNYLWTSAFVLCFLWFLYRSLCGKVYTPVQCSLIVLLSFIAGWMHEGFSVPVISGIFVFYSTLYILSRRLPSRREILFICSYMFGALLIVAAPAFWVRSSGAVSVLSRFTGWESMVSALLFNCMFYAYILLFIFCLALRTQRRSILSQEFALPFLIYILVSSAVATVLFFVFYNGSRMGWYGQLFCGIGCLYLFSFFRFKLGSLWKYVWSVASILLVAVHLSCSVVWQKRLLDESRQILALYCNSNSGTIFFDNIKPRIDASLWKPSFRQFNEACSLQEFSYYNGPDRPDLLILPTALSALSLENAAPTSDSSLVIYKNHILLTDTVSSRVTVAVKPVGADWISSRARVDKFTGQDGRHYTLLTPHIVAVFPSLKIQDAKVIDRE